MSEIDEARRLSFDAGAALYDAVRPSYPDVLADDLLATAGRRVLEIGAGTGKATVVFARRGASIVAIEPGPSLAAVLRRNVAGDDPVEHARREVVAEIDASQRFGAVETRVYSWTTSYPTARYLDLLDTYSDHAVLVAEPRARLYEAIASAIEVRGGVLDVTYVSMAFVARRI